MVKIRKVNLIELDKMNWLMIYSTNFLNLLTILT